MNKFTSVGILLFLLVSCTTSFVPTSTIQWKECEDSNSYCSTIQVPLLWNHNDDDRSLDFHVRMFPAKSEVSRGQLWLLAGGPGISGDYFYQYTNIATKFKEELNEEYDIYIPDHRGTGKSSYLKCDKGDPLSNKVSEVEQCYSELLQRYGKEGLSGFGTTQVAHDIAHFINATRRQDQQVVVYAVSYGTFLLNRLLVTHPDLVDYSIADSVVKPTINSIEIDDYVLEVGDELLEQCQNSEFCSKKFDSNVREFISSVIDKQSTRDACIPDRFSPKSLTYYSASLLMDPYFKQNYRYVLPMFYRLKRCNAKDREWLYEIQELAYGGGGMLKMKEEGNPMSGALYLLITTGDMTERPVTKDKDYWKQKYEKYPPFFNIRQSPMMVDHVEVVGDNAYVDPFAKQYPTKYNKPMLTIHGTMDANTPYSWTKEWMSHYNHPHSKLLTFPLYNHGVVSKSSCAEKLMIQFIKNPLSQLDHVCLKTLPQKLNFAQRSSSSNRWLFEDYEEYEIDDPKPQPVDPLPKRTVLQFGAIVLVVVASICSCLTASTLVYRYIRRKRLGSYEPIDGDMVF